MAEQKIKKVTKTVTPKETVKKPVAKTVTVKTAPVKTVAKKEVVAKTASISVEVVDITGKSAGKMDLPEVIFKSTVNKSLMAQAVRVYLANQRDGGAATKTRGTVSGSTRKIYRQKGTGRARHGASKAPIFVHGGVAHGPHPKDYSLAMPQKMRRAALFSALTSKLADGEIKIVSGFSAIEPKTKGMAVILKALALNPKKKSVLVVTADSKAPVVKAVRNIEGAVSVSANLLNTYAVLMTSMIVLTKEAVTVLERHFLAEGKN